MNLSANEHLAQAASSGSTPFKVDVAELCEFRGTKVTFYTTLVIEDQVKHMEASKVLPLVFDHFNNAIKLTDAYREMVKDYEEKVLGLNREIGLKNSLIESLKPYRHYHNLQMELNHGATTATK